MKSLFPLHSLALAAGLVLACAGGAALAKTPRAAAAASQAAPAAVANATGQPGTPQRAKMKACNADAKTRDVHGPDRRAFMKQCLSGKAKPAAAS